MERRKNSGDSRHIALVRSHVLVRKIAKDDALEAGAIMLVQEATRDIERDLHGLVARVGKDACAQGAERNALQALTHGELQRGLVAASQQRLVAAFPLVRREVVDWSDGVDDALARQVERVGDFGRASVAASQGTACYQQVGPSGAVDGAVYAATSEQSLVCCVHDGIDFEVCDIGAHERDDVVMRLGWRKARFFGLNSRCEEFRGRGAVEFRQSGNVA